MKKDKIKIMVIEDFINLNLLSNFISPAHFSSFEYTQIYLLFFVAQDELKENCEKVKKKIVFLLLFLLSVPVFAVYV